MHTVAALNSVWLTLTHSQGSDGVNQCIVPVTISQCFTRFIRRLRREKGVIYSARLCTRTKEQNLWWIHCHALVAGVPILRLEELAVSCGLDLFAVEVTPDEAAQKANYTLSPAQANMEDRAYCKTFWTNIKVQRGQDSRQERKNVG